LIHFYKRDVSVLLTVIRVERERGGREEGGCQHCDV